MLKHVNLYDIQNDVLIPQPLTIQNSVEHYSSTASIQHREVVQITVYQFETSLENTCGILFEC